MNRFLSLFGAEFLFSLDSDMMACLAVEAKSGKAFETIRNKRQRVLADEQSEFFFFCFGAQLLFQKLGKIPFTENEAGSAAGNAKEFFCFS